MNVAIFASGNGSNAQKIIEYFSGHKKVNISLILTNNSNAYVIERARKLNMPFFVFTSSEMKNTNIVNEKLKEYNIEFIILAGFLLLLPSSLISTFTDKIINIHPALLPKYGGKGMFGGNVHKAVITAKERESGITIHYVNEKYDEGKIIFQARCKVDETDTPETLAEKVHSLEYRYYPEIIEKVIIVKI